VVVPVFNAATTIAACVDSILAQDYSPDRRQLVVVDNGSTDGSSAILRRYGRRLALLDEQVRGPAAARNRGISAAEGRYIAFIDADCIADRHWLSHLVAALESAQTEAVGGRIRAAEPANSIAKFGERIHDHERAIREFMPPYLIGMNWAVLAEALRAVNGFDNRFRRGEDVDLAWRLRQSGCRFAYAPDAVVYHHNESTLYGLFTEGWLHGLHGVFISSVHAELLARHGYRRNRFGSVRRCTAALRDWWSGRDLPEAKCRTLFEAGKSIGRLCGSVRFGYLDL
jgi:GT2 family glycosyltransferase